jgi:hypothetical protein
LIEGAWAPELASAEQIKLLEILLRSTPSEQLGDAAEALTQRVESLGTATRLPSLLRGMFDEVSLTPYTDFVPKTLAFLEHLVERRGLCVAEQIDFLGYLLRQLGRHFTAYDLVTFHHRGANYPDALLLDAALKNYLDLIERQPALFMPAANDKSILDRRRMRRRALRQAWYFRRFYEGHLVPDAPSSPGENVRVLPPHHRVPEEQIFDSLKRTRRLFNNDSLTTYLGNHGTETLRQSIRDLRQPLELRELGMAIFLERPLGAFKRPGEPDQTPLLAYEMFSRSIVQRRLHDWSENSEGMADAENWDAVRQALDAIVVNGIGIEPRPDQRRPGSVSLSDACQVASDFVVLRTTTRSAREFLSLFDWSPLARHLTLDLWNESKLIVRGAEGGSLMIHDQELRPVVELRVDPHAGYRVRGGVEYPVAGVRVRRAWNQDGPHWREHSMDISVLPLERV